MLQVPDLLMIHSPIQTHPVIQCTHLLHQHLLRLESNIILVVLWLACAYLQIIICSCHYRCATTFLQQREDGGITPPCLRSLTARAPILHAGTPVLSYCVCLREKEQISSCSMQLHWHISICAGYQFSGSFFSCNASDPQPSPFTLDTSMRSAEALALSGTVYAQT